MALSLFLAVICSFALINAGSTSFHKIIKRSYCKKPGVFSVFCQVPTTSTTAPTTTTTASTTTVPTTTTPPTTTTSTTVAPPEEQCGIQSKQDALFSNGLTLRLLESSDAGQCVWPWMVSIRGRKTSSSSLTPDRDNTFPYCSGVLVDKQYVLTTAGCVMLANTAGDGGNPTKNLLVVAGEYDTQNTDYGADYKATESIFTVADTIIHPGYYKTDATQFTSIDIFDKTVDRKSNNLALLKLDHPAEFNKCTRKICLPDDNIQQTSDQSCTVASWGNNASDKISQDLPGKLQTADVTLQPLNDDLKPLTATAKFMDNNNSACLSDNGGMVACKNTEERWVLNGLINRPDVTFCSAGEELQIADVRQATEWIKQQIALVE